MRYEEFLNFSAVAFLQHFPVWSEEELRRASSIFRLCWDEIEPRYEILGGVPRKILRYRSKEAARKQIEAGFERQETHSSSLISNGFVYFMTSFKAQDSRLSHTLLHYNVQNRDYETPVIQFASGYVLQRFFENYVPKNKALTIEYLKGSHSPLDATVRGQIFERLALWEMSKGGNFQCRNLATNEESVLELAPSEVEQFHELKDCDEPGRMYIPFNLNFRAIDGYMKGVGFFQCTLNLKHGIHNDMAKHSTATKQRSLYFVVPDYLYDQYGIQLYTGTVKINQFVLCFNLKT